MLFLPLHSTCLQILTGNYNRNSFKFIWIFHQLSVTIAIIIIVTIIVAVIIMMILITIKKVATTVVIRGF